MTQHQEKNKHLIQIEFPLFEEIMIGEHTVLFLDANTSNSRIRVGEVLQIEPESDIKMTPILAEVLQVIVGETYEDVLRMLPPDDVTVQGNGPLALFQQLERFYERQDTGNSFGVLGIRFRIISS